MKMKKSNILLAILLVVSSVSYGQDKLKVFAPGDITIDASKVKSARVDLVDNYGGNGYTSIDHGMYEGKQVLIIQSWFLQKTNYLDYIVVDAGTFETLFRIAPIQGSTSEEMMIHQVKNGKQYVTKFSGTVPSMVESDVTGSFFNIAAIPHLLSNMDLKNGMNFRLKTFNPYNGQTSEPEFVVSGSKDVVDEDSKTHKVWIVDLVQQRVPEGKGIKAGTIVAKTTYLISNKAPYYLGMSMSQIKSKEDLTHVIGYEQKVRGFNLVDKAPEAKDVSTFLMNN
jgi:hypothetical protein